MISNTYARRLAWMFILGAAIAVGETVHALAAEAVKRAPAAATAAYGGKPAVIIRVAPLELKSLDASAFGDWDQAAAVAPAPKARQR